MHAKVTWKPGKIAKAYSSISHEPHKRGLQHPILTPSSKWLTCCDARWVVANGHKTQSFMKNGVSKSAWIKHIIVFYYSVTLQLWKLHTFHTIERKLWKNLLSSFIFHQISRIKKFQIFHRDIHFKAKP